MGSGRIVLFGATGYTGRLTAEVMARSGLPFILAGRDEVKLATLAEDLASTHTVTPTWQVADVSDPSSVSALLHGPDDVLVTTVGPFTRFGSPALHAAITAGVGYIDSTGEPPFVREVFTTGDAAARRSGARLLTAFGYDYVPGNLAGALAIRQAVESGNVPTRVDVGYFVTGGFGISSGTKASAARIFLESSHAFRNGTVVDQRTAQHLRTFTVDGKPWAALSIGGSEHFALPRLAEQLKQVDVYLGWAGKLTPLAQWTSTALHGVQRLPGVAPALRSLAQRAVGDATGAGPSEGERSTARSVAVAVAINEFGRPVAEVRVVGPTPYELTAELLSWGAHMMHAGRAVHAGALGPADAFGLPALVDGCAHIGLKQV
jgi:short subunit dehydrogenase-like uncharacterized protein